MLRLASYDIVFQEIPHEVTLALNLSNCPFRCRGCHSPHLREDIGEILDGELLTELIQRYGTSVTCVCFMGGDASVIELGKSVALLKKITANSLKIGWYSGREEFPVELHLESFNYVKLGPYVEDLGGLKSKNTNQRLYRVEYGELIDITKELSC